MTMFCFDVVLTLCAGLRRRLKFFTLLIVMLFYICLQISSRNTANWNSTRRIGFGSPENCNTLGNSYAIKDVVNYGQIPPVLNSISFAFKRRGGMESCVNSVGICTDFYNGIGNFGLSSLDLAKRFSPNTTRNYFPFSMWIVILCSSSLMLSLLFENNDASFVNDNDGSFSRGNDKAMMIKFNTAVGFAIFIVMIVSAMTHELLFHENCSSLYRKDGAGDTFCQDVQSCQLILSSIIEPSDGIVIAYRELTYFLAICVFFSIVLHSNEKPPMRVQRMVLPLNFDDSDNEDSNGFFATTYTDHGGRNLFLANRHNYSTPSLPLIVRSGNDVLIVRRGSSGTSIDISDSFLERMAMIVSRQKMVRSWRHHSHPTEADTDAECSICLNSLFPTASRLPILSRGDESEGTPNALETSTSIHIEGRQQREFRRPPVNSVIAWSDGPAPSGPPSPRRTGLTAGPNGSRYRHQLEEEKRDSIGMMTTMSITAAVASIGGRFDSSNTPLGDDGDTGDDIQPVVEIPCAHKFHRSCIMEWAVGNTTCPVCRAPLGGPNEDDRN